MPEDEPILRIAGDPLIHVPPGDESDKIVVRPKQTLLMPLTATGSGFTVTPTVAIQPVGKVYVIIAVPASAPPTVPVPTPTTATEISLLDQTPPAVISVSAIVNPAQTFVVPVMAAGSAYTVTIVLARQPVGKVYVTIAVPAETPVTTPELLPTDNIVVPEVLHVPPGDASVSVTVSPAQTCKMPLMADGKGSTIKGAVLMQPVGKV